MKPQERHLLYDTQKALRAAPFELYKGVMRELFSVYQDWEFVTTMSGYFRSQRYDLALELADSLSATKHADATTHFVANQFALLVRKYPWNTELVKTDPEAKAKTTFLKAEHRCKRANQKFRLYREIRSPHEPLFVKMASWIQYVIGSQPPLDEMLDSCDFGPGASMGVHGNATNLLRKIGAGRWSVTPGAYQYAYWAVMRNAQMRDVLLTHVNYVSCLDWESSKTQYSQKAHVVSNNKLSFVPKTARTHRVIAVEPLLNGFIQKGIDAALRKRLKRTGIDLGDQSLNQEMARKGSLDDSEDGFVTIDLSSASDSVSIELVRHLLPPDWFDLLNHSRAVEYELDGRKVRYHKFCSMGNGFCFPLETLLFAACCIACDAGTPGLDFSVYGDDIIVRKKHAQSVLNLLKVMGFRANEEKTFLSGPFRESCGADWYLGEDVRPYTLDFALDSLEALFKWLNITRRNARTDAFFLETRDVILSRIPVGLRLYRPYKGDPDTGIDSVAEEYLTSPNCSYRTKPSGKRPAGWSWKVLRHIPVKDDWDSDVYRRDSVDMYALLRGARPENNTRFGDLAVEYTYRRKTRTTTAIASGSGATSTWVPYESTGSLRWLPTECSVSHSWLHARRRSS